MKAYDIFLEGNLYYFGLRSVTINGKPANKREHTISDRQVLLENFSLGII